MRLLRVCPQNAKSPANGRYLREADGWSRCEAGITGRHTVKNASESKRSYLIDQEGRVPAQAVVGERASTIHATLTRPC